MNMECSVLQFLDFAHHDVFIGEIVSTYCDDAVLTDGEPDFKKINPLLFTMHDQGYWTIGTRVATAWDIGKTLKKDK
jgi:flavin reductase (DIM6/NTAB) family NADH-FMN oxidoreductase RutF